MAHVDPTFAAAAPAALIAAYDAESSTTYAIDAADRIVFTNRAWDAFAAANGGAPRSVIGDQLTDVVPEVLRPFYERGFAVARGSGAAWEHDYQCSSDTVSREFRMRVQALGPFAIISNDLLREEPITGALSLPGSIYVAGSGLITQCAHCRRAKRMDGSAEWDWVPALVRSPPAHISHGLCMVCLELHYP